jgi:curli biogenesis system outer membrane secretion channel CsgG
MDPGEQQQQVQRRFLDVGGYMKTAILSLAAILAFSAVLVLSSCPSAPRAAPSAPAAVQPIPAGRVAIFDFEVKGGGAAFASLRGDIPESLSAALIKGGLLLPVERRELDKALAEQELALSGLVDEATAARVGRLAGARYALLGSASIIDAQVRLSCRLIDIETGEIVYAESARGGTGDIFAVVEKLASAVEGRIAK